MLSLKMTSHHSDLFWLAQSQDAKTEKLIVKCCYVKKNLCYIANDWLSDPGLLGHLPLELGRK
jgi:hypothetical protein